MDRRQVNNYYFHSYEWRDAITYKGIQLFKYPADMVTYQQIIYDTRPEVIIECGTARGASALFLLDSMKSVDISSPLVITIDPNSKVYQLGNIKGILKITGSSLDTEVIKQVEDNIKDKSVMVSLDSDHIRDHVFQELNIYNNYVSIGNYLVVEDTFLGTFGPFTKSAERRFQEDTGKTPRHAMEDFLLKNNDFIVDTKRNKEITMNPNGWLKRIK